MNEEKCCKKVSSDYLVCTCMGVMHSDIVESINKGCKDFSALSDSLGVGTGCSSCVDEVEQILAQTTRNNKN